MDVIYLSLQDYLVLGSFHFTQAPGQKAAREISIPSKRVSLLLFGNEIIDILQDPVFDAGWYLLSQISHL